MSSNPLIGLRPRPPAVMASQDYISQFSQGIPSTQPDRSPSRTPRRDTGPTPHETSVPAFRGPLHMAILPNIAIRTLAMPPPGLHHGYLSHRLPLLQLPHFGHKCHIQDIMLNHYFHRCHLHSHLHRHHLRAL